MQTGPEPSDSASPTGPYPEAIQAVNAADRVRESRPTAHDRGGRNLRLRTQPHTTMPQENGAQP